MVKGPGGDASRWVQQKTCSATLILLNNLALHLRHPELQEQIPGLLHSTPRRCDVLGFIIDAIAFHP